MVNKTLKDNFKKILRGAGLVIERLRVRVPAEAAREFSSSKLTLCADPSAHKVATLALPQWHSKDPGHSAKNEGGRLHLKH